MTPPVLNNDKRLFKLGGVIHCPRTAVYGLMKMMDEEQMQETLPPSFSIRREWTASLYAEKTKGYFFTMTNSLLTRENGLVYNGNNS